LSEWTRCESDRRWRSLNGLTVSGYGGAANVLTVRSLVLASVGKLVHGRSMPLTRRRTSSAGCDIGPLERAAFCPRISLLFMGGKGQSALLSYASGGTFWSNFQFGFVSYDSDNHIAPRIGCANELSGKTGLRRTYRIRDVEIRYSIPNSTLGSTCIYADRARISG